MAYKARENSIRHEYLSLRLGPEGTDEVVETNRIRCTGEGPCSASAAVWTSVM